MCGLSTPSSESRDTRCTRAGRVWVAIAMSKEIHWDEGNLEANEAEAKEANRQTILEPKTPFHTLQEDGETPAAFPPKAPPARAGPPAGASQQLMPGMDLDKIARAAEERRGDAAEDEEEQQKKFFEEHRRKHYKMENAKALLAAKNWQDEEDEEDEASAR